MKDIDWLALTRSVMHVSLWFAVIYALVYGNNKTAMALVAAGVSLSVLMENRGTFKEKRELLATLALTFAFGAALLFAYMQLLKWEWPVIVFAVVVGIVGVVGVAAVSWNLTKALALFLAKKLVPKLARWIEREDARIKTANE